jgi:Family of unknown function (DUF5677)
MSFEQEGFFSPDLDRFREAVRTTDPTKAWFDYALDLNRIGFDLLRSATTTRSEPAEFAQHGIFVRTHQSFQSALILLERGLAGDARSVLRSGVEGAIAIHALGSDPSFVDRLIEAHHVSQRKTARLLLANPDYMASYSPADIAAMQAVVASVDAMEDAPKAKLRDINWADVALKHCPDLYQLLYRSLSSDGTHATLTSLDRYVVTDASMEITAFKSAPDPDGLAEVLSMACLLFLWASDPFAVSAKRPDVTDRIREEVQRFGTLPGAFPRETPEAA